MASGFDQLGVELQSLAEERDGLIVVSLLDQDGGQGAVSGRKLGLQQLGAPHAVDGHRRVAQGVLNRTQIVKGRSGERLQFNRPLKTDLGLRQQSLMLQGKPQMAVR